MSMAQVTFKLKNYINFLWKFISFDVNIEKNTNISLSFGFLCFFVAALLDKELSLENVE